MVKADLSTTEVFYNADMKDSGRLLNLNLPLSNLLETTNGRRNPGGVYN